MKWIAGHQQKGGAMAKQILLEEFDLSVLVSRELGAETVKAIRRTLNSPGFRTKLRRAIFDCFREFPSLANTHVRISR
jgi:hypothetical protein